MKQAHLTIARAALCLLLPAAIVAPAHTQSGAAPAATAGQGSGAGRMGRERGRGVHGTVLSTSGANVSVKTDQGETWTVVTTDNTRLNIDRQSVKVADLKPGDEIVAAGLPDAEKHEIHAMFVMGASAAQVAKLKADMGKTYIVGKVTAMNDTKLTVLRPDKVSQTILLDDSTSLRRGGRMGGEAMMGAMVGGPGMGMMGGAGGGGRRGEGVPNATSGGNPDSAESGESITLADVKVGDNVGGTGSLKNGTFVPSELHVMAPRAPRGERPAGAPAPPPQQ